MNLYFGLFCSAGVLFIPVSYGSIFLLEEKTIDSYSSCVRLFRFYTQRNVNSAANFVYTSKIGLPRVVLVGLICSRNVRLSTLGV